MKVILELQKSIYNVLKNDSSGVWDKINGLYYSVPKLTKFPYIVLSKTSVIDESCFNNSAFLVNLQMNLYDRNDSTVNLFEIVDCVVNLISNSSSVLLEKYEIVERNFKSLNILFEGKNLDICNVEIVLNFLIVEQA